MIDWIQVFNIEQTYHDTEEKLGEIFWDFFKKSEKENSSQLVRTSVDSLVTHICASNNINRTKIKVHILDKPEVNAFALPDNHLVIFSGLILKTQNSGELSGVICHEIAHMELNHIATKLIKEIGLNVIIRITTGNSSTELIKETLKLLSSSAFDRGLEKEADLKAIDYLLNVGVSPFHFAEFLSSMAVSEDGSFESISWISTHPDSKERADYILSNTKNTNSLVDKKIISDKTWGMVMETLREH